MTLSFENEEKISMYRTFRICLLTRQQRRRMDVLTALSQRPLEYDSEIPLYQQLKERILQVIATRSLDADTALPTEQDIAKRMGLARGTVRRCFRDLVDGGHVIRRRGAGTFVSFRTSPHTIDVAFNFTTEITALGMTPSSKVLGLRLRQAEAGVARRLAVPDGTRVWEVRRVRLADGVPMQYVTAYVPHSCCPSLTEKALESSLYALITEASGKMPAKAEEVYEAINLDRREAEALGLSSGAAALRTLRTTYDASGRPFEASVIISRADRNRLMVTLDTEGVSFSKLTS